MPEPRLTTKLTESGLGAHVLHAATLGEGVGFALADGGVALMDGSGELRRVAAHPDAGILVAAADSERLVSGGDDGRVVSVDWSGEAVELGDEGGKWIDAVAARSDGATAWSAGKAVKARDPKGEIKQLTAASTVRGLWFLPKGYRLALAGYGGVSLWFPNLAAAPELLEWRGSHLGVTVSPDNRFVVSSMQENALHGWRIADKKNMRMTGYPAKTRSLSWSADGQWLATSGAEACVVWPFAGKDGPMGKPPLECGLRKARVTQACFHPRGLQVAIGFDDGWILLCRIGSADEAVLRAPDSPGSPISALAWGPSGDRLYYGTEDGVVGLAEPKP